MKSYKTFILELAQNLDQYKAQLATQTLNRDSSQNKNDRAKVAGENAEENSPSPADIYLDTEQKNAENKIKELEAQKQIIAKQVQDLEINVAKTVDPKNEEAMKGFEEQKNLLNQNIEKFDALIKAEQDKQKILPVEKK